MNASPAVSVVMAVFNPHPTYFRQAVESVLAQTFRDFELIVIEDPSPRSAAALLEGIADNRLRLHVNETRLGLTRSLNLGVSLARAPLIARLDGDDLCAPDRLARQVAFLDEHPEIDVYGSRITIIDAAGRPFARRLLPLDHDEISAALRRFNCISHPAVMVRKAAMQRAGGYDPAEPIDDYDLWCRMLKHGSRFENSADDLIRYRFHPEALKFEGIRKVIRDGIHTKRHNFADDFTLRDRLRILGERALLLLPPRLVLWLFTKLQYRPI